MTEVFVLIAIISACQVTGGSIAENEKSSLKCKSKMLKCLDRNIDSQQLRKCLIKMAGEK